MNFKIITLGCKVNTYESNLMRDLLLSRGYIEQEPADIVVINTCSVTNTADHKSMKMIHQARKQAKNAVLIVTGCMSQNKKEEVFAKTDADIVLGNVGKSNILSYLDTYLKTHEKIMDIKEMKALPFENMKLNHFHQTRAFIKIQDGCNNFCSYCIIPYVRGNVRSKEETMILEEVNAFVKDGKKEIVLTGIHTGNYGREKGTSLAKLLQKLVQVEGLERIRISSIEITELDEEMEQMLQHPKIVAHLHIPLQSGSDAILKAMNRKYDKAYFIKRVNELRKCKPDLSITTDVIVGFPGETEEDFQECIETIQTCKFSKLHVFPYSKREGTKAAMMDHPVDETIKKERVHTLLALSKELEQAYMQQFVGKKVDVLLEKEVDGMMVGHTGNYLQVKVKTNHKSGEIIPVILEKITYPYLLAIQLTEEIDFVTMK